MCPLQGSQNKQQLFRHTVPNEWFVQGVFKKRPHLGYKDFIAHVTAF